MMPELGDDLLFVGFALHINKIDNNNAPDIAQPQLPRNLPGGEQVRFQDRFFLALLTNETAGINIDCYQGFSLIEDDVNTGDYVGHRNLEETIYRTNLEAAVTIARQLRLRNLGGIIIIDFIDMEIVEHRRQVMQVLEQSLSRDHARHQLTPVSPLGLVEMTRKRSRESLQHILCEDCETCGARGFIMTAATVCFEIFREVIRQHRQFTFDELLVLAHQEVIELLLDDESKGLLELEQQIGKPIRLQPESLYLQDQFDVVLI